MEETNDSDFQPSPHRNGWLYSPSNLFVIYTIFVIVLTIKKRFGLEAALEFMEKYLNTAAAQYPSLGKAVEEAFKFVSVEKIFQEAMDYEE